MQPLDYTDDTVELLLPHTSQDSFTTYILDQKGLDSTAASIASIVMKTGDCVAGTVIGDLSQWYCQR